MPDNFDYSVHRQRPGAQSDLRRALEMPLITPALCIVCVLLTLAYWTTPLSTKGSLWYALGHLPLQSAHEIWDGHYWGLITSFFIHIDIMHLLFNMIWLWQLGALVELSIPKWQYALFLVGAALVGACSELVVSGQTGAGASGVVYAIFGLMWAGRGSYTSWRGAATRQNLNLFLGWGVLCIFLTYTHIMAIANGGHFGGLLFGLSIGWLCYAPRRRPEWGLVLALLAAVCVMALSWLPWSWEWDWYRGNQEFDRKHYARAIEYYQNGVRFGGERSSLMTNIALAWSQIGLEALGRNDSTAAESAYQRAQQAQEEAGTAAQTEKVQEQSSEQAEKAAEQPHKLLVDPRANGKN